MPRQPSGIKEELSMDKINELISVSGKLTVFFEDPFWVGVFERVSEGKLSACKVTFGADARVIIGTS